MTSSTVVIAVAVLGLIVSAVLWGGKLPIPFGARSCQLSPTDQLLDIYHALYPHKWQADALEFEALAVSLKTSCGLDLNQIWRKDLTLG